MNFLGFFVEDSKTETRNYFFDLLNKSDAILELIVFALIVKVEILIFNIGGSVFTDHTFEKVGQFFLVGFFYRQ